MESDSAPEGSPPTGEAQSPPPPTSSTEFAGDDLKTIQSLATSLRDIGLAGVVISLILLAMGCVHLADNVAGNARRLVLEGLIGLLLSGYAIKAASSFRRIVTTEGMDLPHLMAALREMSRAMGILRVLALIPIAILLILLILTISVVLRA